MLMSKKKSYKLEGDMSYKQSWRIAHNFANQCNEIFPDYDLKKLAHLLQGAIYYYHEEIGVKLSKKEAADFISNEPPVPKYYINALKAHLNKADNKSISKNKPNIIDIQSLPRD